MYKPDILSAIADGSFSPENYSLVELQAALGRLTGSFRWLDRYRDRRRANAHLAGVARPINILLKAIATKWAERGPEQVAAKIRRLEAKAAVPDERPNSHDAVLLDFLQAKLAEAGSWRFGNALRNECSNRQAGRPAATGISWIAASVPQARDSSQ
jgi:hypothetical protein